MSGTAEKTLIRMGDRDYELGSQAHLDAIENGHKAEVAGLKKTIDEQAGRLDAAEKAVEASKREKAEAETKAADAAKERSKELADRVKSRVRLVMRALRLFGDDSEGDGGDDEKKMDALCSMSERDLHLKAIQKADPDFKADGKSDDYIAGKFEGAIDFLSKANGVDGVVQVLEGRGGPRLDANDNRNGEHPVAKARREMHERMAKLSAPTAAGEGGAR